MFPSLACSARSGPAFPPAGLAARCPHAPATYLLSPRDGLPPPPGSAEALLILLARSRPAVCGTTAASPEVQG